MGKIKVNPNDTLAQEAMKRKLKVYTPFNPYFSKDTQVEITTLEQVYFYHKKLVNSRVLGEVVKDKKIRKGKRRRIVKDLVKYWDKDFKENIEFQKKMMLEKTTEIKSKKIKKIRFMFVYLFSLICIISIFLSKRVSYLKKTPFIKDYITNFYIMIETPLYFNLLIILIYLSLITVLYIILLRTYFDILRKVGSNAEVFINDEFKKIFDGFVTQHKKVKRHLLKTTNAHNKKSFKIKKIFDPNVVLKKLTGYSQHVEKKIIDFRKKYHWLLFFQFLLKAGTLGLTIYLGYIYYNNFY
ncbi:hypothetical protein KHQ81_03620 [Mycoplasmatota bacterium]|nr:hypothetical protein KHQ81_03620 [Mycoplasmatota bacterium]